jgi:hypothetical protein
MSRQLWSRSQTDEKADLAASTDELMTTSEETTTGSASSIILTSSPETDTQLECLDQTALLWLAHIQ